MLLQLKDLKLIDIKLEQKNMQHIEQLYSTVEEQYLDSIKAFASRDKALATKVIVRKKRIMDECIEFSMMFNQRLITELIEELKKIERSSVIIARITVDME